MGKFMSISHGAVLVIILIAAIVRAQSAQNPFIEDAFPKIATPGTASMVTWTAGSEGTVTLKLYAGVSPDQKYISTIAHFIQNKGSYAWTPSIGIEASDDYNIMIISDADNSIIDYSPVFSITTVVINRRDVASGVASSFFPEASYYTMSSSTTSETLSIYTSSSTTQEGTPNGASPTTQETSSQATVVQPATATVTAASGNLSTSAAIGVGVGVGIGALLVIGLIVFLIFRSRRRRGSQLDIAHQPEVLSHSGVAELSGKKLHPEGLDKNWKPDPKSPVGPGGQRIAELSEGLTPEEYQELEGRRRAVELEGRSIVPQEVQGNPRAELDVLRANASAIHEIGVHR